jgi:hypothetical protein
MVLTGFKVVFIPLMGFIYTPLNNRYFNTHIFRGQDETPLRIRDNGIPAKGRIFYALTKHKPFVNVGRYDVRTCHNTVKDEIPLLLQTRSVCLSAGEWLRSLSVTQNTAATNINK